MNNSGLFINCVKTKSSNAVKKKNKWMCEEELMGDIHVNGYIGC